MNPITLHLFDNNVAKCELAWSVIKIYFYL